MTRQKSTSPDKDSLLDELARSPVWQGLTPDRLIPLFESADARKFAAGEVVFEQFHPAAEFYLLARGAATRAGGGALSTDLVQQETIDWPHAALGWSGFLAPQRYGSTVRARDSLSTLHWSHARLAEVFYADPLLSVWFFDLVLDSVRKQLAALRQHRVLAGGPMIEPPQPQPLDERRPVVGRADSCLRRSAFFGPFPDLLIETLGQSAELDSCKPGERIVRQDDELDGLLLLASGRANIYFEADTDSSASLMPFRRFHNRYGIIAGVPALGQHFLAEASVYAETHCWIYRLPSRIIQRLIATDPEFGRAFQQRLLARMAGWVGAIQVIRDADAAEPEVTAVANTLADSRARLPVTSELYKVPHLLRHRLTVGNAFAVLHTVADTGRYHERLLAARCNDMIADLAAENAFYHDILAACEQVISADASMSAADIRAACDTTVEQAFAHLDCRVHGAETLPKSGGNIFVMNHIACPEYYELPNHYHFSFDTAFVSCIAWKHYGRSAVRVVRESPDAEFGHNLFYRRLGHITVPTLESDVAGLTEEEFATRRRAAGEAFAREGREMLAAGINVIICPEGQSQPAELSPVRFHTGAFRLALDTNALVIPVALAGFDRRYKDGPLVAIIGAPIDVNRSMQRHGQGSVREFADWLRGELTEDVRRAQRLAAEPAVLSHPD